MNWEWLTQVLPTLSTFAILSPSIYPQSPQHYCWAQAQSILCIDLVGEPARSCPIPKESLVSFPDLTTNNKTPSISNCVWFFPNPRSQTHLSPQPPTSWFFDSSMASSSWTEIISEIDRDQWRWTWRDRLSATASSTSCFRRSTTSPRSSSSTSF